MKLEDELFNILGIFCFTLVFYTQGISTFRGKVQEVVDLVSSVL